MGTFSSDDRPVFCREMAAKCSYRSTMPVCSCACFDEWAKKLSRGHVILGKDRCSSELSRLGKLMSSFSSEQVRRLEAEGLTAKQAEAITHLITEVLHESLETAADTFVSKPDMQKVRIVSYFKFNK